MSLINDALKRAKEAHQQVPVPPADLPFRPVEPAQQSARRSLGLLLPVALAVLALLVLFLAWQWVQRSAAPKPLEAAALTPPALATAPAQAIPAPVAAPGAVPVPASQPKPPAPAAAATPAVGTADGAPDSPVVDVQESPVTNSVPVAAPEPPKPVPLRLQAIFFHPKRPSAIISGKTVFVGDKVRDLRVVAIDQGSATLAGAGQTNVLSLAE
jgi:hypothetical protein